MKLRYLLLFALVLIIPAGYANAGPIDPSVIINKCKSCDAISFTMDTKSMPLIVTLINGQLPFTPYQWEGQSPLTTFYIALADPQQGELLTCSSNIFKMCGTIVNIPGTPLGNDVEYEFYDLYSTNSPIVTGETFSAQVTSPEPSTGSMLFIDGMVLIGLQLLSKWRKREFAKI
jgi:hypothetical protein